MSVRFEATDLKDIAKWLRHEAVEAGAKGTGLCRNKSDQKYYLGQQAVYQQLAGMIEREELVIKQK